MGEGGRFVFTAYQLVGTVKQSLVIPEWIIGH